MITQVVYFSLQVSLKINNCKFYKASFITKPIQSHGTFHQIHQICSVYTSMRQRVPLARIGHASQGRWHPGFPPGASKGPVEGSGAMSLMASGYRNSRPMHLVMKTQSMGRVYMTPKAFGGTTTTSTTATVVHGTALWRRLVLVNQKMMKNNNLG